MKTKPILFSGPMVRALLDGKKTQTRRIAKVKREEFLSSEMLEDLEIRGFETIRDDPDGFFIVPPCPYGQPGDLLWVRETFARNGFKVGEKVFYRADNESQFMGEMSESNGNITGYYIDHWVRNGERRKGSEWKPSIHIPRWASRLTLEITNIRVENLQAISNEDAEAEGFTCMTKDGCVTYKFGIPDYDGMPGTENSGWEWKDWQIEARQAYKKLWESINGSESWDANPWVWVIEFIVHKQNVDEYLKGKAA